MIDLSVELAGLKLKNPIIAAAGPNTKNVPSAISCMEGGFGAIVIRSLHLQYLNQNRLPSRGFWNIYGSSRNFTKGFYSFQSTGAPTRRLNKKVAPGFGGAARVPKLEEWTDEVRKIVRAAKDYDCAVIASTGWCGSNLSTEEEWRAEAKAMADAGVDAIQLHTAPSPATEPGRYIMIDPERYLEMPIKVTKQATNLPVFAKIPVDCCDTVTAAIVAQKAGADGIVPVTRWLSLTVDIDHEKDPVWRGPGIGGPWSVPIMNGLVFRIRNPQQPITYLHQDSSEGFPGAVSVTVPVIPSGGVRSGADVIGYLMAGANAAEMCAQVILEGVNVAERIEGEIRNWMAQKGYNRINDFRGTLKLLRHEQAKEIPHWLPLVDKESCTACKACVKACPNQAISLIDETAHVDQDYCEGCRTCYYVCPAEAISLTAAS